MVGATRFLMLLASTSPSPLFHRRCPTLIHIARRRHRVPPSFSSLTHCQYHKLPPSSLCSSGPQPLKIKASHQLHIQTASADSAGSSSSLTSSAHPWPEWSNFIHNLSACGYFNRQGLGTEIDDEFVAVTDLPEDFVSAAAACLAFARDRPDVLGMLSRTDIKVVVEKGLPFLFKNGDDTARRMRLFLDNCDGNVMNTDKAATVDLMRFLLSYASNLVSSEKKIFHNGEIVESSVRNLLIGLAQLSYNNAESRPSGSVQNQFVDRYAPRRLGPNIEMKRGDWICPRCSFMNFARNAKCLECEEVRPKRQLTGGEWECPQCDFFNYGRNMVCLRCDCKRPGELALGRTNPVSGLGYGSPSNANKAEVESRLAANEEKAQRWFSKVSQLDSSSDISNAIADEDFPEIMPLRKGVNRFVVSTRKTPLERRLVNAQYQRKLGDRGTPEGNDLQSPGTNKNVNQSLPDILGLKSPASDTDDQTANTGQSSRSNAASVSDSGFPHNDIGAPKGSSSSNVPFVPLPADMFAKKPENSEMDPTEKVETDNYKSLSSSAGEPADTVSGNKKYGKSGGLATDNLMGPTLSSDKEKEQAEKSEKWFKRVAELHDVTDLASTISDDDFPEIMPMRKGESRFLVGRNKDRSLTSPMSKRRMAMEQANNTTNYVLFVPFPPNYFARKDHQQPDGKVSANNGLDETSNHATPEKLPVKLDDSITKKPDALDVRRMENQQYGTGSWNPRPGENSGVTTGGLPTRENPGQHVTDFQPGSRDSWSSGYSRNENVSGTPNIMGNPPQNFPNPETSSTQRNSPQNFANPRTIEGESGSGYSRKENVNEAFTGNTRKPSEDPKKRESWSGKSLEGSLVKEPDPLDMSEEAKAERWFRRVAQIKDISELSNIPDEDFPSIMPMRKGVNRFVVSKRKTPLERRLTSSQYRKNLPIVSSDPVKESDGKS